MRNNNKKIVVKTKSWGYEATIYTKFLFFWLPRTSCSSINFYLVIEKAHEWKRMYNIPDSLFFVKHQTI